MSTLREALDKIEEAKAMLSEVMKRELGLAPEKIAVRVNNEREFKVLMEHYEATGKQSKSGRSPLSLNFDSFLDKELRLVSYEHEFCLPHKYKEDITCDEDIEYVWSYLNPEQYTVVDFDFFCAQHGLSVPKFVMRSQDGVDLYHNDKVHHVCSLGDGFMYNGEFILTGDNLAGRVFSTKEAAEAWCAEANKPKETTIEYGVGTKAVVTKEKAVIHLGIDGITFELDEPKLKQLLGAIQSLQKPVGQTGGFRS